MNAGVENRITMLERRCRLLLRLYPVAYRSERGEEIIGTLLEATPGGRAWPLPRDIRGLVTGGFHARAQLNRRNTTAANLRVAVLVGVAAYLAYVVAAVLGGVLFAAEHGGIDFRATPPVPFGWPLLVVANLLAATLVLAWLSRRRAIVLAGALPAAGAIALAGPWPGSSLTGLACLAVLIAAVGQERPDLRWWWLIGLVVLARLLISAGPAGIAVIAALCLLPTLAIVGIVWLPIDARPAIAIVVFLLAAWLPPAIDTLAMGVFSSLPLLSTCAVVAAVAVWLLRRQSARPGRTTRT